MSLRVRFVGGPADSTERDYPRVDTPLPSLLWFDLDLPERGAVYRRVGEGPDSISGRWRYEFTEL
jgi:hypothetical protein